MQNLISCKYFATGCILIITALSNFQVELLGGTSEQNIGEFWREQCDINDVEQLDDGRKMSNPASTPTPLDDVQGDGRWMSMHNRFICEAKEKEPEVLFVGDSLIQQLQWTEFWRKMFEPLHCLNFGIGGDQTQHVLWRLMNGELECIDPKVVVLLVGTNNYDHTAEQVADGIMTIVNLIQDRLPRTQVIVMGIPPRGEKPNKLRTKLASVNAQLKEQMADLPNATFLPVDVSLFVHADGAINPRDMHDYLHLTPTGYQKFCEPLLDEVQNLMKTFVKVDSTSVETASLAGHLAGDMS